MGGFGRRKEKVKCKYFTFSKIKKSKINLKPVWLKDLPSIVLIILLNSSLKLKYHISFLFLLICYLFYISIKYL